jgi:tight adherence protein C
MTEPDLSTIVVLLAGAGAFISVLAAGLPFLHRDPFASRLKAVAQRRQELSARQRAALQERSARFLPRRHVSVMRSVLNRLNLQTLLEDKALRTKLAQAGWRRSSAAVVFVFARVAVPIGVTALALVYFSSPAFADWAFRLKLTYSVMAGLCLAYLPSLLLANAIEKRQKTLRRAFPDALDLMVICVESGLSIEATFQRVTEEIVGSAPALAEEIALTSAELAFLGDRRLAYDNLSERTGLAGFKSLCTALLQSERYGTPLSVALRVLAQENRDTRMAAAEKKAAALPAKLTVPMIVFFLPVLFMIIIGPAAIQVSHLLHHG